MENQDFSTQQAQQNLEEQRKWLQGDMQHHDLSDEHYSEPENPEDLAASVENKRNADFSYQTQKIIINEAEDDEEDSPTYKDFFEKDQKRAYTQENMESERGTTKTRQRWEILYEKAIEAKLAKQELAKERESRKEDAECTFKPKLVTVVNKALQSARSDRDAILPIQERTKLWKKRIETRLTEDRDLIKDKDLIPCTFRPDTSKSQGKEYFVQSLSSYGSKGIDQYLRRQVIAKQAKIEKETILDNPLAKLPSHVYKKDGTITVPKGPDFNRNKQNDINSLKKPFEFPTPKPVERDYMSNADSPGKRLNSQQEMKKLVNPVHVNNVKFGDAIQILHEQLLKININTN